MELNTKFETQPYELFTTIPLLSHICIGLDRNSHAIFIFYE